MPSHTIIPIHHPAPPAPTKRSGVSAGTTATAATTSATAQENCAPSNPSVPPPVIHAHGATHRAFFHHRRRGDAHIATLLYAPSSDIVRATSTQSAAAAVLSAARKAWSDHAAYICVFHTPLPTDPEHYLALLFPTPTDAGQCIARYILNNPHCVPFASFDTTVSRDHIIPILAQHPHFYRAHTNDYRWSFFLPE